MRTDKRIRGLCCVWGLGDIKKYFFLSFLILLRVFSPLSCSADCPSLWLLIQSTRNQRAVKPLRTTHPLHANVIIVEEERGEKKSESRTV